MQRVSRYLNVCAAIVLVSPFLAASHFGGEPPVITSKQSGAWSASDTWDLGRVPRAGDCVVILSGHHVIYDVDSQDVIRLVQVAGTLDFARDRDTRLDVGLLTISSNEVPCEEGFDCQAAPPELADGKPRPALLVGIPNAPIPAKHTALIRLHYVEGMDKISCPAIVCCGGRMEVHGSPLEWTWVKLKRQHGAKASGVAVSEAV